jgi:hypothetical protein
VIALDKAGKHFDQKISSITFMEEKMETKMIFLFCVCDEFLHAIQHQDDKQCQMTTAEVMTFAIASALFFQGNYKHAKMILAAQNYFTTILSLGRLNRRLHLIPETFWQQVLLVCRYVFCDSKCDEYIIDSFPVPVCQNCRISRCKLFPMKGFHGYCASKQMYFLGIKVHMIINKDGVPVECIFTPGSESDTRAMKRFEMNLPAGSYLFGDKAYNDYQFEDLLQEVNIHLVPHRKNNSRRKQTQSMAYLQKVRRKRIETVFSQIISLMPRSIHAVTAKGFLLKVYLFIVAFSVSRCATTC